jgi:hypothetical protein
VNLVCTRKTIASSTLDDLEANIVSTLGQNNAHDNTLILNTFRHLRALDQRDLQDVRIGVDTGSKTQERGEVIVPTDTKAVVPATEDGVAGLQLQVGGVLTLTRTVAAG